jgi:hypothetical protein
MANKRFLKWKELGLFKNINQKWSDVSVLIEVDRIVTGGGGYSTYSDPWKKLQKEIGDEKTKRVIKLYCNYKGIEYDESREINDDIKVTGFDFEIFVKKAIRESITVKVSFKK